MEKATFDKRTMISSSQKDERPFFAFQNSPAATPFFQPKLNAPANTIQQQPAAKLPEFTTKQFVNGNFANFDAQYDVKGPVPAMGTLFASHGVHMNYPAAMTKPERKTFETDFVTSIHDKWSNKHLLMLAEPGFATYQANVDVSSHIEENAKDAHTVIDVVKPKAKDKRFRSRVSGVDKKEDSKTTHKAKMDFRDPTDEQATKIDEPDFIRNVANFDFDSDKINADCQGDIDAIIEFIKTNAPPADPDGCSFSLRYTGRASSEGSKAYNKKLSERRIKSVQDQLDSLDGLCLSMIEVSGEEEATEDPEFRRVSVGVSLNNSTHPDDSSQNVAAHEFGHMIGLGDEYVENQPEIPGSTAKFFGDKPSHFNAARDIVDEEAADETIIQNSTSIMARGNDVNRAHYLFFAAAIDVMTRPQIEAATGIKDAKWMVI
jgi:outer membrane protein OmpA-like peptidoglycan-associated protein